MKQEPRSSVVAGKLGQEDDEKLHPVSQTRRELAGACGRGIMVKGGHCTRQGKRSLQWCAGLVLAGRAGREAARASRRDHPLAR